MNHDQQTCIASPTLIGYSSTRRGKSKHGRATSYFAHPVRIADQRKY
jgi:hypothetical protein